MSISGLALAFAVSFASPAIHAAPHEPQVLVEVVKRVRSSKQEMRKPVVVFDLDDTLINTRERTLRIVREFIADPEVQNRFPTEVEKLARLKSNEIQYWLKDTFAALSVSNPVLLVEANAFWKLRFFTNAYCAGDNEIEGAVRYVRELYAAGADIVYLTGRDSPGMQEGTLENLRKLGFPYGKERSTLFMKPDARMDDLEFKRQVIAQIRERGEVVAAFENEPANMNLLHGAFPEATAVFLDTIHSPKPDRPADGVHWIGSY